ncbi:MAG: hypothetical protein JWO38_2574, partial [Gemmataceae bacterium]|nr:hypothetical protein [Gemmataceae bacterium]
MPLAISSSGSPGGVPEPPGALVELSEARCGGGRTTDLPDAGVVRTSNRR